MLSLTKPKKPHVRTIATKRLIQIVDNDGYNESHTRDYGPFLDEIKAEIRRRYEKIDRLAEKQLEAKLNDPDYILATIGRTCSVCNTHATPDQVPTMFYKKLGKYRTECKDCSKQKIYDNRKLKKIDVPF